MYNEQQAKNGFKTFVVTLTISLLLFGTIYYLMTDFSNEIDIEPSTSKAPDSIAFVAPEVKGTSDYSVFGGMSDNVGDAKPGVVLAGADEAEESTESTVPVPGTGSEQVMGAVLAIGFFSTAVYVLMVRSRKFALAGFEKDALKD